MDNSTFSQLSSLQQWLDYSEYSGSGCSQHWEPPRVVGFVCSYDPQCSYEYAEPVSHSGPSSLSCSLSCSPEQRAQVPLRPIRTRAAPKRRQQRRRAASEPAPPCDAPLEPPAAPSRALSSGSSSNMEIPKHFRSPRCTESEDEADLAAAALQALPTDALCARTTCSGTVPIQMPSPTAMAGFPASASPSGLPSPSPGSSVGAGGAASAGTPPRRPTSLLDQLSHARAETSAAHEQVRCLQDALLKERQEVVCLRAQLERLLRERDGLLHA